MCPRPKAYRDSSITGQRHRVVNKAIAASVQQLSLRGLASRPQPSGVKSVNMVHTKTIRLIRDGEKGDGEGVWKDGGVGWVK